MSFEKHFVQYGSYHANPVNKWIHIITVPIIVLTALIFLIRVEIPYVKDLANLLTILYSLGYVYLHFVIGTFSGLLLWALNYTAHEIAFNTFNGYEIWKISLLVHVVAWITQLLGHALFEKRAPAFLDNLLGAFVFAPLFVFSEIIFECGFYKETFRKINAKVMKNVNAFKKAMAAFEATLDGQVSLNQNDPLLLLNDDNKMWWYVKNLRLNETGYVPAEYVEMPFERIARFNRAKNIQETKPLDTEISDVKTNVSEKKKKVEFAALVDYDKLPAVPTEKASAKSNFGNINSSISKWFTIGSIKTSKWFRKYITNFGKSKLELLKVHVDNFDAKSPAKTILLDETTTIDNLVATCLKRFGIENEDKDNYYISLLLVEERIIPDREELVKKAFSKYVTYLDNGTGRVYISKGKKIKASKTEHKSETSESIANQKKLSHRVSLLETSKYSTKASADTMTNQEFISALNELIDSEYPKGIKSRIENITTYQDLYKKLDSSAEPSIGKLRSKDQLDQAFDQPHETLGTDVNENMELLSLEQTVHDTIQFIRQKYEPDTMDHGLLYNKLWLDSTKSLEQYGMKQGDILEYRKKHRVLQVRLMNKNMKSILIDESQPITKIVSAICQKIGLSNAIEYSLIPINEKSGEGLHDDSKWLHPDKTLREQGIAETDMVLLKKKFFFSDQLVNKDDPVQLDLLYSQAYEMILQGKHPITLEEAVVFAGLQMQIVYGNHEPDRFKKGFVALKDFLPSEYVKHRDIEKKIYSEHAKLYSLSCINAKFKYVQLSRSLKTYGITFFLERASNKKTLTPFLLGVSKDGVHKMDIKSKTFVSEWKLTQIRRWASTENSFTLDLGDFADSYFAFETTQGYDIAQQVSGYISIILKCRKDQETLVQDSLIIDSKREISVRPAIKKQMIQATIEDQANADQQENSKAGRGNSIIKGLCDDEMIALNQRRTLEVIQSGLAISDASKADLLSIMNSTSLHDDPNLEAWRNEILNINIETIASMSASKLSAAALLIIHATGNIYEMDYATIEVNIKCMIENLRQISQNVKVLATLFTPAESEVIIQLGKTLVDAFASVLIAIKSIILGETFMEKLYDATSQLADTVSSLLFFINKLGIQDDDQKNIIISAGDIVQHAQIIQEKSVWLPSSILDNDLLQNIQQYAYNMMETSSMLVAVTEVLSPVLDLPRCRETFFLAIILMEEALKPPSIGKDFISDPDIIAEFINAIEQAEFKLAALIDKLKNEGAEYLDEIEVLIEYIYVSTNELLENIDVDAVLQHAKDLMNQLESLSGILEGKSKQFKTESEQVLALNDSKKISNLSERLAETIKISMKKWSDLDVKSSFSRFIKEIQSELEILAAPYIIASSTKQIIRAFTNSLASTHQLISAAKAAGSSNRDQESQLNVSKSIKDIYKIIQNSVQSLKFIKEKPNDHVGRSVLMQEASKFLEECEKLIASCKNAIPAVSDLSVKENLSSAVKEISVDVTDLKKGCSLAILLKGKDEINLGLASLRMTQGELEKTLSSFDTFISSPTKDLLPREELNASVNKRIKSINNQLNILKQKIGDYDKKSAGDLAINLVSDYQNLAHLSSQLAKYDESGDDGKNFMGVLISFGSSLDFMLQKIQKNVRENLPISMDVENIIMETIITMESLNDFLPGTHALSELEESVSCALEISLSAWSVEVPPTEIITDDEALYELENNLRQAALAVAVASSTLAKSNLSDSIQVQHDILCFQESFQVYSVQSNEISKASYDIALKTELGSCVQKTGRSVLEFIGMIKKSLISSSPTEVESVSRKLRETIDSIQSLIDSLTSASNSKNPFGAAFKQLDEAFFALEKANENHIVEVSFEELIESANLEGVMVLNKLTCINDLPSFKEKAENVASSIKRITLANANIISFIVSSDNASQLPSPPVIDQYYFSQKIEKLRESIQRLNCEEISRDLVLNVAQEIAKITGKIIVQLKAYSKNEKLNFEDKSYFANQAREIGMNVTLLVDGLKALATVQTDESRKNYQVSSEFLLKNLMTLATTCESPRFGKKESIISLTVAKKQRRLFERNVGIIHLGREIIKNLKQNPEEPQSFNTLKEAIADLLLTISKEKPLYAECETGKSTLQKSINIILKAKMDPAGSTKGSRDPHNRKTLANALSCITSLVELVLSTDEHKVDYDKTAYVLQDMVKHFTSNVLLAIDIGFGLHATYRNSLFDMYSNLGTQMIYFLEKIEIAALKSKDEMQTFLAAYRDGLKNQLTSLTAFLVGITDDSLNEYKKITQNVENIMAHLDDLHKTFVLGGKQLSDFLNELPESEAILDELVEEVTHHMNESHSSEILDLAQQIPSWYINMANVITGASIVIHETELKANLKENVKEFGGLLIQFVESMRNEDIMTIDQVAACLRNRLAQMKVTIENGSHEFVDCRKCLESFDQIMRDYDASIQLAATGYLDPITLDRSFIDQKTNLLKQVSNFSHSLQAFSNIDRMSKRDIEKTITQSFQLLLEAAKAGLEGATMISSIGGREQQKSFLSDFKDTIHSIGDTLKRMLSLKESEKNIDQKMYHELIKNCQTMLEKSVSDITAITENDEIFVESIDSTHETLKKNLEGFLSDDSAYGFENPGEVLMILHSFEEAVHSVLDDDGSDQNSFSRSLNILKLKSLALLEAVKSCVEDAPVIVKENCSQSTKALLESLHLVLKNYKYDKLYHNDQTHDNFMKSRDNFEDLMATFRILITKLEPEGFWDKNDPNVRNARDLAEMANSLEHVSWGIKNKVGLIGTSSDDGKTTDEGFQGSLMKAVKEIAESSTALIKASIITQREIVKRGKTLPPAESMYFSDGTWSDGIVSAAKDVGTATKELSDFAKKELDDNNHCLTLIAIARQINASTVQILTASSVHTDSSSKSQLVLNSTGKHLMSAIERLIKICEEYASNEKIDELSSSVNQTSRNAEELDAKLNILKLEKQLDKARLRLGSMRKERYSKSRSSLKIMTSAVRRPEANYSTRLGSIVSEVMENAVKRAGVLELVDSFENSPQTRKMIPEGIDEPNNTFGVTQRRGFQSMHSGKSSVLKTTQIDLPKQSKEI